MQVFWIFIKIHCFNTLYPLNVHLEKFIFLSSVSSDKTRMPFDARSAPGYRYGHQFCVREIIKGIDTKYSASYIVSNDFCIFL